MNRIIIFLFCFIQKLLSLVLAHLWVHLLTRCRRKKKPFKIVIEKQTTIAILPKGTAVASVKIDVVTILTIQ